jgi:hypothetical protein
LRCPHCENEVTVPPDAWFACQPWHCSHCGELFGVGNSGIAFPVPTGFKPLCPLLGFQIAKRFGFYAAQKHYVYALCWPSGLPFYVGVGQGERCLSHELELYHSIRPAKWTEKHDIIQGLKNSNDTVWYHFLALTSDRQKANNIEAYWISDWGIRDRGGMLTNLTIPSSPLEEPSEPAPEIPEEKLGIYQSEKNDQVIRVFTHPDYKVAVIDDGGNRTGAVRNCSACGKPGQFTRHMRHAKVLCGYCGHYLVPWTLANEDGSDRVLFGEEVIKE